MDLIANPIILSIGLAFLAAGYLLLRRAKSHSIVDASKDAAWESLKNREAGPFRRHIESTVSDIVSDGSNTAIAKKIAGMAAREAMARVLRVAGIICYFGRTSTCRTWDFLEMIFNRPRRCRRDGDDIRKK